MGVVDGYKKNNKFCSATIATTPILLIFLCPYNPGQGIFS
ncbi:hypothetical protein MMC2321_04144 [Chitinophaga sp. MM2321]